MKFTVVAFVLALVWFVALPARAQVYFHLSPEAVKSKATRSGFEYIGSIGTGTDSLELVFKKKEDPRNTLTCRFNDTGLCYQFSYRLPTETATHLYKNLEQHFVARGGGVWESKEKNFLVRIAEEGITTTVVYLPYLPFKE